MLKLYVKSKLLKEDIKSDIEGASLIEYSILIGLISAAVIALIVAISAKVTGAWTTLDGTWQ